MPENRVSTRLLRLVQGGAKPSATTEAAAPPGEALARRALLIAYETLAILTPATVLAEQVNATSTIVQAFDKTAQFLDQELGAAGLAPSCWRIVATALSCVLGGVDPNTIEPYGAAGAAFTAFAGACLLLQSLNQMRESLLCVAENDLLVPTGTEDVIEELEHTAFCDDCLKEGDHEH